jgi:predicted transcriptional regulator
MKPLTDLELAIMQVLWDAGGATAREVHEALRPTRPLAYTTVLTVLNILVEKGHLRRRKEGRAYRFIPRASRQKTLSAMLDEFLRKAFGGSALRLVYGLVEERKLSRKDLEEIGRLLEKEP